MSYDSRIISMDANKKNDNSSVAVYNRQFDYTASFTSSLVVQLRHLQTTFQAQHQHEKHSLVELNERFRHFVDRVHQLEAQNTKYMSQLGQYQYQSSGSISINTESSERYLHIQSDLTAVASGKVDFELQFEMFHLQIAIYQQLIDTEQQWKDERRLQLEQELSQLSSSANTLRASFAEKSREVESLYKARAEASQHHLSLTSEWFRVKKTTKDWQLSSQAMKSQIAFYKNLRSHSSRGYQSVSVGSFDVKEFWTLELQKSIKKIRHDFEQLYAGINLEISAHYKAKIEEAEVEVQQEMHYSRIEMEQLIVSCQTLQVEYEKVQSTYSYEQGIHMKLEASCSKLELELKSLRNYERVEMQSKDEESLQESIMALAFDIEEMRQRKINLESEIIVYRHLLDTYDISEPTPVSSTTSRKFVVKSLKKGPISIKECPPDGAYISLMNHSTKEDVDLSRWVVKRHIDSRKEIRYTIPDRIQLQPGGLLRIYSKLAASAAKSSAGSRAVLSHQELVNNDAVSWGAGDKIETVLLNRNGEEKANHLQLISMEGQ